MAIKGSIGLVGGGNMGSALLKGLIAGKAADAAQMVLAEMDQEKCRAITEETGVKSVPGPMDITEVDLLILAVKPGDAPKAALSARAALSSKSLVITLAAGLTIETLSQCLPEGQPVVRAMPNTPALISRGATAIAPGPHAGAGHMELAREVFGSVGVVVETQEKYMDAVTGLSGSGPAYVFLFIESLADAGVAQGLDRATALTLAANTVAGASQMLLEQGGHPAVLKDMVTSPGGTTIAGLHTLEQGGFKGLLMDAVESATLRGHELGGK